MSQLLWARSLVAAHLELLAPGASQVTAESLARTTATSSMAGESSPHAQSLPLLGHSFLPLWPFLWPSTAWQVASRRTSEATSEKGHPTWTPRSPVRNLGSDMAPRSPVPVCRKGSLVPCRANGGGPHGTGHGRQVLARPRAGLPVAASSTGLSLRLVYAESQLPRGGWCEVGPEVPAGWLSKQSLCLRV